MEYKLNNKGFSLREFIAVLLIMVIATIVVMNLFFKGNKDIPYKSFRNLAKDFSINATQLHANDIKYNNRVYLIDAIKNGYMNELVNPFNKKEKCDQYESKVVFEDGDQKRITIKCGKYLIFNESGFGKVEDYTIYEVSDWTDKELVGGDVQTEEFYNYSINGSMLLDNYLIEKEFMEKYSAQSGRNILSLSQVDTSIYKLESKTYYRTMKEVD